MQLFLLFTMFDTEENYQSVSMKAEIAKLFLENKLVPSTNQMSPGEVNIWYFCICFIAKWY